MKKLIPLLLALIGTGAGVGAGIYLKPEPAETEAAHPCGEVEEVVAAKPAKDEKGEGGTEFVKMNNQFVVPVVVGERVRALVVMSLSLEVPGGQVEAVFSREPKLRDAFLQVLFDHANVGGFEGSFTRAGNLDILRTSLREAATKVMAGYVRDVLITDIARQDM